RVWPAGAGRVRTDEEGRVQVTVPATSAVVYRADRRLPRPASAPAIHFESPTAAGVVGGRAEIGVGVPAPGVPVPAQVTFAWRHVGAQEWTVLGTDDNAPYRVFHDVSTMPKGTMLEYRAVLEDPAG